MRVCVLMPFLDAYKGGNHLPLLAACAGTEFTILTNRCKPAHPDLPSNVEVEQLSARIGPYYYGIADRLFARAVLKRYPPTHSFWKQFDVLHFNQTLGTQFLSLQHSGVPLLYAVHHPVSADREVVLAETSGIDQLLWRAKYAMPVAAQKTLCKRMPHIMTVSSTMKRRLQSDYGTDPARITVVPNGVDGSLFTPVDEADTDIIAVGSFLHPRKGFRYLLTVYTELSNKGYTIADVGKRSDEQRSALEQIKSVTVHGVVEADQLVSLVQRSRCLVSTSLFEGFGLSLIEALSCNRPAFAFDVGAVREVLEPIDASLIVAPRDTDAMVQRIDQFLQHGTRPAYRDTVLKRYSLQESASCLKELYHTLCR